MKIELVKKGNRYAIRRRFLGIFWLYWNAAVTDWGFGFFWVGNSEYLAGRLFDEIVHNDTIPKESNKIELVRRFEA